MLTQVQHRQAGFFQLFFPHFAQVGVVQDGRNDARAVIWRERIVLAVQELQHALRQFRSFFVRCDGHQDAGTFAVDAKVFRTGRCDQAFTDRTRDQTGCCGVCVQTVTETLVGDVDQWDRAFFVDQGNDLFPLVQCQVCACWVVAAAVQQNNVASCNVCQISHHASEINVAGCGVEIAVRFVGHAQIVQDRHVVWPRWVRYPNGCVRRGFVDQFHRLTDRACAARSGHSADACAINSAVQHQIDHAFDVLRFASQRCVRLGGLGFPDLLFGSFDRLHHRSDAFGIFVNTNAQVDFVVAWVFAVGLHQGKDFIGGLFGKMLEHHSSPVAIGRSAYMPHSDHEPSYSA